MALRASRLANGSSIPPSDLSDEPNPNQPELNRDGTRASLGATSGAPLERSPVHDREIGCASNDLVGQRDSGVQLSVATNACMGGRDGM
jgi:hypothetical protein